MNATVRPGKRNRARAYAASESKKTAAHRYAPREHDRIDNQAQKGESPPYPDVIGDRRVRRLQPQRVAKYVALRFEGGAEHPQERQDDDGCPRDQQGPLGGRREAPPPTAFSQVNGHIGRLVAARLAGVLRRPRPSFSPPPCTGTA